MTYSRYIAIFLLFISPVICAGDEQSAGDKPSITASHTESFSAVVEAIDHQTRELTLLGSNDKSVTFIASEDARNLEQVEIGDVVTAEFHEQVTIAVHSNDESEEPGVEEIEVGERNEEGQMPGATAIGTMVITSVVEAIDIENNTFILRGPDGSVKEFVADDSENLRRSEVGDLVIMTVTQSVGFIVKPAGAD